MAGRWRSEGKVESFGLRYKTDKTLGDTRKLENNFWWWGPTETFFSYQYWYNNENEWSTIYSNEHRSENKLFINFNKLLSAVMDFRPAKLILFVPKAVQLPIGR